MQWLWVGLGAAVGAILRWWLSRLNGIHPWLPYGTLLANVLGGLLMGVALVLAQKLSPALRLFITTGFLGGLTTFSTFSAEVFTLLNTGKMLQALAITSVHILLTLLATAIGFYSMKLLMSS